jgi:hypothetical protein
MLRPARTHIHQHVRGLDVTVDQAGAVGGVERRGHRGDERRRAPRPQAALPAHYHPQVIAAHEAHRDEQHATGLAGSPHALPSLTANQSCRGGPGRAGNPDKPFRLFAEPLDGAIQRECHQANRGILRPSALSRCCELAREITASAAVFLGQFPMPGPAAGPCAGRARAGVRSSPGSRQASGAGTTVLAHSDLTATARTCRRRRGAGPILFGHQIIKCRKFRPRSTKVAKPNMCAAGGQGPGSQSHRRYSVRKIARSQRGHHQWEAMGLRAPDCAPARPGSKPADR